MSVRLFDSHAHLNSERFKKDAKEVRQAGMDGGVVGLLNVGYDLKTSRLAIRQAEEFENVWAAVGIHPHDAKDYTLEIEEELRKMAVHPKVVAIGEMGLDYHYMNSPKEVQREVFIKQMELAREVDLPIIIHDREAHAECLELIQTHGQGLRGVFHCFSGSKEFALEVIRLGFYVSFAGPVTYKNARNLKEAAQVVPLDRILIETDCPYLAPDLYRGKRNEPLYVGEIAKEIGELRKISLEEVSEATLKNACDLFTISL